MIKVEKIRLALMEKIWTPEVTDQKNLAECIIHCSANLDVKAILHDNINGISNENYEESIGELLKIIYKTLLEEKKKDIEVDTLGIWIHTDNDVIENSMAISILEDIEKYSVDEVNPFYEFYKMSIEKPETEETEED